MGKRFFLVEKFKNLKSLNISDSSIYKMMVENIHIFFLGIKKWTIELLKNWFKFFYIIFERFFTGFKHPDFIIYFVTIILIVGGLGVWLTIYPIFFLDELDIAKIEKRSDIEKWNQAISTFFIAIIASSSADLILMKEPKEHAQTLKMFATALLVIGGVLFVVSFINFNGLGFRTSIIGSSIALFFWWISNSYDKKYQQDIEVPTQEQIKAPLGGKIESLDKKSDDFDGLTV